MSEELIQISPKPLGRYSYFRIGSTTLKQLKDHGIIHGRFSGGIKAKKPDGLITLSGGVVKAVVEYKPPSKLRTKKQIAAAINQELEVAKHLCKILIVSSGKKTFWINALNGSEICNSDESPLTDIFDVKEIENLSISAEESFLLESLIDRIDQSITEENNVIKEKVILDPSSLAKTLWQKIWINTGKEPEKCLYNVVELFVFKFLSDVGVLKQHNNFESVHQLAKTEKEASLKHYARTCRIDIKDLFPAGDDGTTIINGTIFVNEKGEPNLAQSSLFKEVIEHLQKYDSEFGSFRHIDKEFKTRLYESFLRQNAGIKFLGQYFTPRNVVQAVIRMSDANLLKKGARVCDPFCGVGGFLLELLVENKNLLKEFEPKNNKVSPDITFVGYDKGSDEKDDERTIILAKANMLIYFSDLLVKYHSEKYLKQFSKGAFNSVFKLIRSNLGTFSKVGDEAYDLILTNPPYVTSGTSSLKKALQDDGLGEYYTLGARGTESLAIDWIVKNLKSGGQSIIVVPDGLLNQESVLEFLKTHCIIQAVISLPIRTFYSTPKKTYILAFKKKLDVTDIQSDPIFTYLVSEIGESRDSKRFKIVENDLHSAVSLFNQFKGAPSSFQFNHARCKVIGFRDFNAANHWMVDRWWNKDERLVLGIEQEGGTVNEVEYKEIITQTASNLSKLKSSINKSKPTKKKNFRTISISNEELFHLSIGERILKKDVQDKGVPAYSANVQIPFGFIKKSNLEKFDIPSIIWGIDGNFDWGFIEKDAVFATTDHCGRLIVKNKNLDPLFVFYALKSTKDRYGFDRTYRASLKNMKDAVTVDVPLKSNGEFDLKEQKRIALRHQKIEISKKKILDQLEYLSNLEIDMSE